MIDTIKIHESFQRTFQRRRIVKTHLTRAAKAWRKRTRVKELVLSFHHGHCCRIRAQRFIHHMLERLLKRLKPQAHHACKICRESRRYRRRAAHGIPELVQTLDTFFWRVTRDNGRINRSNGNTGQPVRLDARLGQPLIGTTLVCTQCTTPLKYQNRFFVGRQVDFFHESHSKQISNGISLMRGILTRFFQTFVVCRLH